MAADLTLKSNVANAYIDPTPANQLTQAQNPAELRTYRASYTVPTGDVIEDGDIIRLFSVPEGFVCIPDLSRVRTTAGDTDDVVLDIGTYEYGDAGALGTVIDQDAYALALSVEGESAGGSVVFNGNGGNIGTPCDAIAVAEAWVVAEVETVTGIVAGDILYFEVVGYTPSNK